MIKNKKDHICCICKENVISRIGDGMWLDGTVEKITFGYGSKHDMDSYTIAICDTCIDDMKKDGFPI